MNNELKLLKGNKINLPTELNDEYIYVATSKTSNDYSSIFILGQEWHSKQYTDLLKLDIDYDISELQRQISLIVGDSKRYLSPLDDETPKIFWEGSLPTAKADGEFKGIMTYVSKNETLKFYATLTVQGNSSVNYPKKNFTIKFYTDDTYTTKTKIHFKDWGHYDSLVMKANWVDHSHLRIIGASEIWKQVMESRNDFEDLPNELKTAVGHGATLGWSFRFYVNSLYYGLYEMIIAKKDIFGQDKKNPLHSILISEYNNKNICVFDKSIFTNVEFDDCWAEELQSEISDEARVSFGNIIKLIESGTNEEVLINLPNMIDIQSVIDFDIFARIFILRDNIGKNQIFASYDSNFWYEGAWDLDWALNGSSTSQWQTDYQPFQEANLINKLYSRVEQIWLNDFKARYWQLREHVLSYSNISKVFENFNDCVAPWLEEDYASSTGKGQFTDIPSVAYSNIQQIRNSISYRLPYVDAIIKSMVVKVDPIMINVDKSTQTFTLNCETTNAIIYYTTDGTIPTTSSTVYNGATAFVFGTTLKAIAMKEGVENSDMLVYEFEEDDYYRLIPYKKIFGHSIRGNEKDINNTQTQRIDVYKNNIENYPLWIRGKYLNTCAKYAFVNADFVNNPITENLIKVEGKYQYIAGMTIPEQINTEIEEYVDAPYIAITVIEQGGGVSIPYTERFNLYTTNPNGETKYEEAIPAKTITSKKINNDTSAVVESWGTFDIVLYNNDISKMPYMIKGEHMINNASMYAFVNEDFYNNPITENIISVGKDKYPYKADQIDPILYETPIGEGDIVKTAPYIAVCVSTNSNILTENRIKLYMKKV